MIKYDWNILSKLSHNLRIDVLFALLYKEDIKAFPRSILEPITKFEDMTAFLKEPRLLLDNVKRHTETEIYLYLELAAMRSYIDYKETGNLKLPTYYIEDKYNLNQLRFNTTLIVTNETISFIYEEK